MNSNNLYEQFLKDIHPELLDQFNRFIKEKDVYKQFIQFAHPEFERDFKTYTQKFPVYENYRVGRFYVNHPDFPKLSFYLDLGVDNKSGKYILLDKENKPVNNELYDNVGILSYAAGWKKTDYYGIYLKKGNSYAMVQKSKDDKSLLDFLQQGTFISEFKEFGLPHYKFDKDGDNVYQMFAGMVMQWFKDETIILDEKTKLVPDFKPNSYYSTAYRLGVKNSENRWEARNIFYVGKLPEHCTKKDRIFENFLEEWKKADDKQKEILRNGLGYSIGFR